METRFGSSRFDTSGLQHTGGKDHVVLSGALQHPSSATQPEKIFVFDACHVGVILRAVVVVELVMAVAIMFHTDTLRAWLSMLALVTGAALPATLLWLVTACALKRSLHKFSTRGQYSVAMSLGALSGIYGCALLYWMGFVTTAPWAASSVTGAILAGGLVSMLVLRAKRRVPASAAARLAELQARIRPHFLFNTLNSAIALVRFEPAKAESVLEDLSELFRSALIDQGESASVAQEIDLAKRYLDIEQVRFGERLRVSWDTQPQAMNARLPPLILQPLIENAVVHGVEPSGDGAEVKISAHRRGDSVVIKVTNTAPEGQGAAGHGVALANARERLSLLHDVQCDFRCTWTGDVYQVRIEVPA